MRHRLHDIQSHPTSRNICDGSSGGESWKEKKVKEFRIAEGFNNRSFRKFLRDDSCTKICSVNSAAVFTHFHDQTSGVMSSLDTQRCLPRFSGSDTLVWTFDAVINCVAHKMSKRRFELSKNLAVHGNLFASNDQANFFPECSCNIPNGSSQASTRISKWTHAA